MKRYYPRDNRLEKNTFEYFPDIYGLNKKKNENDLNINFLFNDINKKIEIEKLNQLHKNFINSIKNHSGIFSDKNKNNQFSSEINFKNQLKHKQRNNFFEYKNHYQKLFGIKKNGEIINKDGDAKKKEKKNIKFNNNKFINAYNSYNINVNKIELLKENSENIYDKNLEYSKFNNRKFIDENTRNKNESFNEDNKKKYNKNEKVIKKRNSIKINQHFLKDKQKLVDKKDSTDNSLFSIHFSNNSENNDNNSKKENDNKNYLKLNIKNKINNNKPIFSKMNLSCNNNVSKVFSFISKDKNFSFQSTKNMKIGENNNINSKYLEDKEKNNKANDIRENEKEISNVKYNFKTSSNFFSSKFKNNQKNIKEKDTNIKDIIKNVIENNKKAAQARVSTSFYNIGKNYLNNKMRYSQKNFYSSSNNKNSFAWGNDTNFSKEQEKDVINSKANKKNVNSIQLILNSPTEWENHEKVWFNISNKNYIENLENFLLPPNDTDILISSYLKAYPNKLNICIYSKINPVSKNEKEFLSFYIDDDIQNPRNEIKIWKNIYKNMIFRWHPDKLFPLLK